MDKQYRGEQDALSILLPETWKDPLFIETEFVSCSALSVLLNPEILPF